MKAITRQEVNEALGNRVFPDFVIESFNEAILEAKLRGSTTVVQDVVMDKIISKHTHGTLTRQEIYDKHWLDVEDHYRKAGWSVTYDKPAYYENYKAYWTFI